MAGTNVVMRAARFYWPSIEALLWESWRNTDSRLCAPVFEDDAPQLKSAAGSGARENCCQQISKEGQRAGVVSCLDRIIQKQQNG